MNIMDEARKIYSPLCMVAQEKVAGMAVGYDDMVTMNAMLSRLGLSTALLFPVTYAPLADIPFRFCHHF
jgi:hypothetical protein